MSGRIAFALALGVWIAVGEVLAAAALRVPDAELYAWQAGLGLLAGLGLALVPLPARWLPCVPLAVVGWLLVRDVGIPRPQLGTAGARALQAVVAAALALGLAACLRGLSRRAAGAAFGAAYAVLALGAALLLFPIDRAPRRPGAWLCLAVLAAAPLAAGLAARALASPGRARRVAAALALALLLVAPFAASGPIVRGHHRALPPPEGPAPAEGRDVILIVLDTTRADRLSAYGYERPTTPSLEALARRATRYERAVSQGVWTLPGHASMFTGLYPSEHGAADLFERQSYVADEAVTLAERFRLAGYATACVAANHLFSARFGLTQGFDTVWAEEAHSEHLVLPRLVRTLIHAAVGRHTVRQHIGALERGEFAPAREVVDAALDWLDAGSGARPRFLFLNFMEAHGQLRREPCGAPRFGEGRPACEFDVENYAAVLAGREDPEPRTLERYRDWYDSQLACLDRHLGELFAALDERGLFDPALLVVTADHGEMLGDHRAFNHKSEVWEGLLRVPLVVKLPGQQRGTVCTEVVEIGDLATALPWLAGLPPLDEVPDWAGSAAFVPEVVRAAHEAWTGDPDAGAPCPLPGRADGAVSQAGRHRYLARDWPERWDRGYLALRQADRKFVRTSRGELFVADVTPGRPERQRAPTPEEEAAFAELLASWEAGLGAALEGSPALGDEDAGERFDALRQLGYVEDGDDDL